MMGRIVEQNTGRAAEQRTPEGDWEHSRIRGGRRQLRPLSNRFRRSRIYRGETEPESRVGLSTPSSFRRPAAGAEIPRSGSSRVQKYPRKRQLRGRNTRGFGRLGAFMWHFSPLRGGSCRVRAGPQMGAIPSFAAR
jgi:hypothetical protein